MMPSIGPIPVQIWRGFLTEAEQSFKLINRPRVDDTSILWNAVTAKMQSITTRHVVADLAAARSYERAVRALYRESVEAIDQFDRKWNVAVCNAVVKYARRATADYLVTVNWSLLPSTLLRDGTESNSDD